MIGRMMILDENSVETRADRNLYDTDRLDNLLDFSSRKYPKPDTMRG